MRSAVLIFFLPLMACAGSANSKSPDFRAGYSDGCASASLEGANKRDTAMTRDDAAYQSNPAYRQGWGSGFGACRSMDPAQTPAAGPFGSAVPGVP